MELEEKIYRDWLEDGSTSDSTKARLFSASAKKASYWLSVLPTSPFVLIRDVHLCVAVRNLLGLPVSESLPFRCACGASLPSNPDHAHVCYKLRRTAVTIRHNMVLHCLARLARRAGATVHVEPQYDPALVDDQNHKSRPDMQVVSFTGHHLVDVSVTHPCAASYVGSASSRPLSAANARAKRKIADYGSLCASFDPPASFVPFVFETFGAAEGRVGEFVNYLAKVASTNQVDREGRFRYRALTALAVALQVGNARVLLSGAELARTHAASLLLP